MLVSLSEFGKKLLEAETGEQFEACMRILMEKGPSQIEVEVTNLSPLGGGTEEVTKLAHLYLLT